jgi:hypothetical protein
LLLGSAVALSFCPLPSFEIDRPKPAPALPAGVELAVAGPETPRPVEPRQVEESILAIRNNSTDEGAFQANLAITRDHVIVQNYFRLHAAGALQSSE